MTGAGAGWTSTAPDGAGASRLLPGGASRTCRAVACRSCGTGAWTGVPGGPGQVWAEPGPAALRGSQLWVGANTWGSGSPQPVSSLRGGVRGAMGRAPQVLPPTRRSDWTRGPEPAARGRAALGSSQAPISCASAPRRVPDICAPSQAQRWLPPAGCANTPSLSQPRGPCAQVNARLRLLALRLQAPPSQGATARVRGLGAPGRGRDRPLGPVSWTPESYNPAWRRMAMPAPSSTEGVLRAGRAGRRNTLKKKTGPTPSPLLPHLLPRPRDPALVSTLDVPAPGLPGLGSEGRRPEGRD